MNNDVHTVATMNTVEERYRKSHGGRLYPSEISDVILWMPKLCLGGYSGVTLQRSRGWRKRRSCVLFSIFLFVFLCSAACPNPLLDPDTIVVESQSTLPIRISHRRKEGPQIHHGANIPLPFDRRQGDVVSCYPYSIANTRRV